MKQLEILKIKDLYILNADRYCYIALQKSHPSLQLPNMYEYGSAPN